MERERVDLLRTTVREVEVCCGEEVVELGGEVRGRDKVGRDKAGSGRGVMSREREREKEKVWREFAWVSPMGLWKGWKPVLRRQKRAFGLL